MSASSDGTARGGAVRDDARPAPRITILLPTRNGLRYLPTAIASVLAQDSVAFELIVSDNYSTDGTGDYLATLADPRLTTQKPPRLLSMVEHFEFILSHARGEWVTAIGDDDGLLPGFFERLAYYDIDRAGVDMVAFERAYYFWGGCDELYGDRVLSYWPANQTSRVNSALALLMCVASIMNYMQMPQLYASGLVRRRLIEAIRARNGGRFFVGPSPDVSSSAALALHGPGYLRIEEPIFWTGTSSKSVGYSHSAIDKTKADEFKSLNRRDQVPLLAKLPPLLVETNDLAMLTYEAIVVQPRSGWLWASRFARNIMLAGLWEKSEAFAALIPRAYASRTIGWELRPFRWIVRGLARYHRAKMALPKTYLTDIALESNDRSAFPTLAHASDAVRTAWDRHRAAVAANEPE